MPNRLADATSPYLLQHKDNPVDWQEWGPEAFQEAADRDVPVILSVGYSACHWCHVMAHESFEDGDTAIYMNEHFVNIKVDREERPDVDRVYMDAVTAMTGRGGWPMTVFLTPDQKPIFAGTYYPKQRMANHPSFMDVMAAVDDSWTTDRSVAVQQADRIATAIAQTDPSVVAYLPQLHDLDRAISSIANTFDSVNGGFGSAPKFPQAPTLELLLRAAALRPGTDAATISIDLLTQMLTTMAKGGIYDHLRGGFARYSVDAQWLIPHFEKMLYDNALLASVYLHAWQLTDIELFKDVAVEILDYLDTTMADPAGGIHSAEDADSEGVEGKFAVWSWEELGEILGDDRELAAAIYGATPEGNFEGTNNLHRFTELESIAAASGLTIDEIMSAKLSVDDRLRAVRADRVPPGRDDKIVTAWNGMAMRAFAEAGAVLGEERFTDRAQAIAHFLLTEAFPDGELVRSWRGVPGHMAFADDHAAVAIGLYTLYQTTGDVEWFTAAEAQVAQLRAEFSDPEGGFFATSASADSLIVRPKNTQDNPTPSDNALSLEALLLHASFTGDIEAIVEAERTMRALSGQAIKFPSFGGYTLAIWLTHLVGMKEVAIVGEDTQQMQRVIWEAFRPNVVVASGDGTSGSVPLLADRPGAMTGLGYVCVDLVCDLPVDTADDLRRKLTSDEPTQHE